MAGLQIRKANLTEFQGKKLMSAMTNGVPASIKLKNIALDGPFALALTNKQANRFDRNSRDGKGILLKFGVSQINAMKNEKIGGIGPLAAALIPILAPIAIDLGAKAIKGLFSLFKKGKGINLTNNDIKNIVREEMPGGRQVTSAQFRELIRDLRNAGPKSNNGAGIKFMDSKAVKKSISRAIPIDQKQPLTTLPSKGDIQLGIKLGQTPQKTELSRLSSELAKLRKTIKGEPKATQTLREAQVEEFGEERVLRMERGEEAVQLPKPKFDVKGRPIPLIDFLERKGPAPPLLGLPRNLIGKGLAKATPKFLALSQNINNPRKITDTLLTSQQIKHVNTVFSPDKDSIDFSKEVEIQGGALTPVGRALTPAGRGALFTSKGEQISGFANESLVDKIIAGLPTKSKNV